MPVSPDPGASFVDMFADLLVASSANAHGTNAIRIETKTETRSSDLMGYLHKELAIAYGYKVAAATRNLKTRDLSMRLRKDSYIGD